MNEKLQDLNKAIPDAEIRCSRTRHLVISREADFIKIRGVPVAIPNRCERLPLNCVFYASDLLSKRPVPILVDFPQQPKCVLIVSKPDVEAMLDVPTAIVSSTRTFSTKPPTDLIKCHLMLRSKLSCARQFEGRTQARNSSADD
jgi:hypothetical protein